jgi:predicted Zn-dependent peptidase
MRSLPSEHLNTIIDLEADRMENLSLVKESFESERMLFLKKEKCVMKTLIVENFILI